MPGPTYGPDGLQIQTVTEVQADLAAYLQSEFGTTIQATNGQTVIGQLVSALSQILVQHQEGIDGVYQSLHLDGAQGVNLDRLVQLLGLTRNAATASTCTITVANTGPALCTVPTGAVFQHTQTGTLWSVDVGGNVPVAGAASFASRSIELQPIAIPALSAWTWVTSFVGANFTAISNAASSELGTYQETDAALRLRVLQSAHTAGKGTVQAIRGAIADLDGVTSCVVFENVSNAPGITSPVVIPLLPAHSFVACVIAPATPQMEQAIAGVLYDQKPAGIATYGNTAVTYTDPDGVPYVLNYELATSTAIVISATVSGGMAAFSTAIKDAIITYIGGTLSTGDTVLGLGMGSTIVASALECAIYDATKVNGKSACTGVSNLLFDYAPAPPVNSANLTMQWNEYPITSIASIVLTF